MCRLRNKAMHDYQESVPTGQTYIGQSDPYVPLCFAGDTKIIIHHYIVERTKASYRSVQDF